MSDLQLQWMADELHDAGLKVIEHSGWQTRSVDKPYSYKPVGVIDHHTAGSAVLPNYPNPPFYSFTSLENKCNLTIQPDGYVVCLNAGIANDSGMGDPAVLNRLLRDEPVGTPKDFNVDDRVTGNPWFIDVEVQHLGNGGPIVPVQRDALILTNAVLLDHYRWDATSRLLGHREWTTRKIDPRWDGFSNPMPQIRADTKEVTNKMNAAQEAKLDAVLANLAQVPKEVWMFGHQPATATSPEKPSVFQYQFRTYQIAVAIRAMVAGFDAFDSSDIKALAQEIVAQGVGQALVDALVAELTN